MPKPIVNNKIIYPNIYGRISAHDTFLNQGVRNDDSPTFGGLYITGDSTINGNLYVEGNTTILGTNVIEFEDNIILLNRLETGSGVTLNQSGIEIDRGTLENYRIIFNESDDTFRVGAISNTQVVTTREDSPLENGLMTWNNSEKRIDSKNTISINVTFLSTSNSTSSTTGSLQVNGGIGIKKDLHMDGKLYLTGNNFTNKSSIWTNTTTNSLNITSPQDLYLTPQTKIVIPFNIPLIFGSDSQYISANNTSNVMTINANGDINFEVPFGKKINIPNQIPITFSTQNEKIYADDSNNMIITGFQDILLTPGTNKKVLIPVDKSLAFYNENQRIYSNLTGDLFMLASNNINLIPGANLDVRIPSGNGLKLGATGNQRIYADSSNKLYISSVSDLYLNSTSSVKLSVNIPLTFGNANNESITGDTFGNLNIIANNKIKLSQTELLDTTNSTHYANGSLVIYGGTGVAKNLNVGGDVSIIGNLVVNGTTTTINTEILTIEDNLFVVNNTPISLADGGLLIKRFSDGISNTSGNIYSGIFYKESTDEITLAYTTSDPGTSTVEISGYIPIHADKLILENSSQTSITTPGGMTVGKNIIVNGGITAGSINATASSYISILHSDYNDIISQT